MQTEQYRLETKSAETAAAYEDFNRAFAAYRETNDAKLAEIEAKLGPDVITEEKLARIDAVLDTTKRRLDRMKRPNLAKVPRVWTVALRAGDTRLRSPVVEVTPHGADLRAEPVLTTVVHFGGEGCCSGLGTMRRLSKFQYRP